MEQKERDALEKRLQEAVKELDERNASIPIHSIRPHQLIEIEELEDEIADIKRALGIETQEEE